MMIRKTKIFFLGLVLIFANISGKATSAQIPIIDLDKDPSLTPVETGYYGKDNRYDSLIHPDSLLKIMARSTAGQVNLEHIKINGSGQYEFLKLSFGEIENLCPEERFFNQPVLPSCTGFLVAPDILVTAGHCMESGENCENYGWIFDYDKQREFSNSFGANKLYWCTEILERSFKEGKDIDYAVIKLDREVDDRSPLKVRRKGRIQLGEEVVVIGHPSGLPTKIAGDAIVVENSGKNIFITNIDSFRGNSGSPVINANNGLVEGIVSFGSPDFIKDYQRNCYKSLQCTLESCGGEKVVRITETNIHNYLLTLPAPKKSPNPSLLVDHID